MTSKSKSKGNSWERDVAKHLTELYGEPFVRVPNSGAYIGGANTKRKQVLHEGQIRSFKGDIIPGQSFPKFNCECKSYGDFGFHQLFQGESKQLNTWIDQLLDVADSGDFNILFMKFNRKGKFVVVNFDEPHEHPLFVEYHMLYTYRNIRWAIMDYDRFWNLNKDFVALACQ